MEEEIKETTGEDVEDLGVEEEVEETEDSKEETAEEEAE